MPVISIGGRKVRVDDSFMQMSPEEQQATVDEIESQIGGLAPAQQTPSEPMFKTGPVESQAPAPMAAPTPQAEAPSNFQVGAQAVGKGVADVLGMPGDINTLGEMATDYAFRGGDALVKKAVNALFGTDFQPLEARAIEPSAVGSDAISGAFDAYVAAPLGFDSVDKEEMTPGQRLGYEATRFGTAALVPSAGMAKAASSVDDIARLPGLFKAYGQAPGRVVAGDVAAGVGAGSAMQAVEDYAPEEVQGPLTSLAAVLAGGTAGNTLANIVTAPKRSAQTAFNKLAPAEDALRDPQTGIVPRRETANQAAAVLQDNTTDIDQAIRDLVAGEQFMAEAGGTIPTTAMLTDDVGLRAQGKAAAVQDGVPFIERQEGVKRDATQDVQNMRPADADPYAPRGFSEALTGRAQRMASGRVARTEQAAEQAAQAETAIGETLRPMAGLRDAASEQLDKAIVGDTMKPMQAAKNEKFRAIDPGGAEMRDLAPLAETAASIADEASALPASLRGEVVPQGLLDDIESLMPKIDPETGANVGGEGVMSFKAMNEMRPLLAEAEQRARSAGQYRMADNLRELKNTIGDEAERLAGEGGEAGTRASQAVDYYAKEFAPLFNRGEGGRLRKDVNRDDKFRSNTPPTRTASRFLSAGEGGKEKAADLQRILESSPSKAEGQKAARDYVMADLASSGAVRADGRVSEITLQTWLNKREGMLGQMPEVRDELQALLKDVRGKGQASAALKAEVRKAADQAKLTDKSIQKSALSLLIDRDPDRAVASVLASKDPLGAARELNKRFAGNKAAQEGWKAAFTDHLLGKLTDAGGEVTNAKISQLMKKNEKVLREVYGDDLKYLNRAQKRMEFLARQDVRATAGSDTAANIAKAGPLDAIKKPYELVVRMVYGALTGGSMVRKFNLMADQLPSSGKAAQELYLRAQLDPAVAKHLLQRPKHEVGTATWNKELNRLMGWTAAGRAAGEEKK